MKFKILAAAVTMTAVSVHAQKLEYPAAPKSDVVDEYFGIKVADPYRPLENDTCEATRLWIQQENVVTQNYLSQIPFRDNFRARLGELADYKKIYIPWRGRDGMFYFYKNEGLENQAKLYRKATIDGEEELFLDPNSFSDDGTVALGGSSQSKDGKYTAYTISRSGSDWVEIFVMDTKTKELLPDHIVNAKFSGATWYGDGFFYSCYDVDTDEAKYTAKNENHRIYYHRLGTPQGDDVLYFEDLENPLHFHNVGISEDETMLFLYTSGAGSGAAVKARRLDIDGADWVDIETSQDYDVSPMMVLNGKVYILSTKGAPNGQLLVSDIDDVTNMRPFIPEREALLEGVYFTPTNIIVSYLEDVANHAYVYTYEGERLYEVKFPALGSVGFSVSTKYPEVYYSFTSMIHPLSVYEFDIKAGESRLMQTLDVKGYNPDDYFSEQVFYPSADGTMIPMTLTYKKGVKRDGSNPVYLYGYGGFSISLYPGFSWSRLLWLENGGIYAEANLRGGLEYGETWHEQGTKLNKKNVFNDFIAAAEYLIQEGWTNPSRIAIEGGSNGGLLIGAVTNMRPDLFAVAIPRVGVMDMLRYHLFTIGWNWAPDYGTVNDSKEMAEYLISYSPAHNIRNDGTPYPAIMVTTADHDDRVVPAHSFKYTAALQAADTGDNVKIIRIDTDAGHGAGKPMSKTLDEYADLYSFIFFNMGIDPTKR